MGSMDRPKKKVQLWKKGAIHFLICFVMGLFIGFSPTNKSSFPSLQPMETNNDNHYIKIPNKAPNFDNKNNVNKSLVESEKIELKPRRQLIVITPTNDKDPLRGVLLRRLGNTLKLVPPPLLWIVVEFELESSDASKILRRTGVMYRHLVFKERFANLRDEIDYQRNLALSHIEHHRLSGIVHFAGLSNVYDLNFFEEIRAIESIGTWPLAKLSERRKKAIIEGPICESSQVIGWHLKNSNPKTQAEEVDIHISGFGFNSSILWDPERWGRLSSPTKQNSLKFVKQAVTEDETKLKGLPPEDCSRVNLWQFHLSTKTVPSNYIPDTLGASLG